MANIKQIEVNNVTYDFCDAAGRELIAPEYVPGNTYKKGDYVIYNNELYRCKIGSIDNAWSPNHWESSQENLSTKINENENLNSIYRNLIIPQYSTTKTYLVGDYVMYNNKCYYCNSLVQNSEWSSTTWSQVSNIENLVEKILNNISNTDKIKDAISNFYIDKLRIYKLTTHVSGSYYDLYAIPVSLLTNKTVNLIASDGFNYGLIKTYIINKPTDYTYTTPYWDITLCEGKRETIVNPNSSVEITIPVDCKYIYLKLTSGKQPPQILYNGFNLLNGLEGLILNNSDLITAALNKLNVLENYTRETSLLNTINFRGNTSIYDAVPLPAEKLIVILQPEQITYLDYPTPTTERPITNWSNVEITTENSSGESNTISVVFPSEAGTIYGGVLDLINGTLDVNMGSIDLGLLDWELETGIGPNVFSTAGIENYINKSEFKAMCPIYRHIDNVDYGTETNINTYDYSFAFLNVKNTGNHILYIKDSRFSDKNSFKAAMSGVEMVYELQEPIPYNLTPQQLNLFKDYNNISTTAGEVVIAYRQNNSKKIEELENLVDALIYDRNNVSQTTDHGLFITNQPVSDTITGTAEIKVLGYADPYNPLTFTWKREGGMGYVDLDINYETVKDLKDSNNLTYGSRITTNRTTSSMYKCVVSSGSNTLAESRPIYLQKQI